MKQWVNACIREFLIPLLNYIMECVLMTTEIAEHISSMHSLPKVLLLMGGHTSSFLLCSKSQAVMSRKVSSTGRG